MVQPKDIILVNEIPCMALGKTLEATEDPAFPNVRFRGCSVFDGREWETTFRYDEDVSVATFTEDANVFDCVVVSLAFPCCCCSSSGC